jgi:(4-(4-[2-(gamma-L-glutamylamino)ethyl]phenoxymethyl)furan-2-yl)methanamine synthase
MTWLGLDIGGANLKAADGRGWARSMPFPLWQNPGGLAGALAALLESAPAAERLAVTMTGELCDCFRTKAGGVRDIVTAVQEAAGQRDVRIYTVDGRFLTIDESRQMPELVAAINWHALARFACRFVEGESGLLIDVGSTTTDIIPLIDGCPRTIGLNDTDRLLAGELVYTGVGRTPVCAIVKDLVWRGKRCPVAAELFATAADAYVVLGELAKQPEATWTADGRPLTREFSHERLARMICADTSTFSIADAEAAAATLREAQLSQLEAAVRHVAGQSARRPETLILSGHGEFLGQAVVRRVFPAARVVSLSQRLGEEASRAAPAHALAVLVRETC